MEKFIIKNDIIGFSEKSQKFHGLILDIWGNDRLIQIQKKLAEQIYRCRKISLNISGTFERALNERRKITKALKQGDSVKADELSKMYIKNILKNILTHEIKKWAETIFTR